MAYMTLYAMTFPIVQRYSLDAQLPRGTGPYWYIRYDSYTMLRLERNPLWWKRQPYISSINCLRFDETVDAMTAISTGQIDMMATREAAGALSRQLSDRSTWDYSTVTWECLVPNLQSSIISDLTVRKAIMFAIDRTTLADNVYLGMAQESEVPITPGTWLYETQSTQYNYNPERAYQMLTSAGWHDSDGDGILDRVKEGMWQDLEITIVTYNEPGIPIRQEAVKQLVEQLGRVGIRVNVKITTKSGMKTAFKNNSFDLALVGFNLSEMPDLTFLLGTGENGNCSEYSSEDMDGLLKTARNAGTPDELKSAMSDIQMLVVEDLPVMGLFFRTGVVISTVNLDNLIGIRETHTMRGLEFCQID
jgi:peptide/nickel transport system substrate-binding protein